ncbi:type III secretion system chaperone family protein [Noviherbaspirillum pedocola]|uniref:CesT family type III secretion system chaperone n=1 Tax=Noviherbaspirillum pedocola TaxID=2801341 RepID=A0A934W4V9_9BURK|nr:CesT family type III secretion system chaperone [Noviherbaspirillum pedocola]MBK4733240.1 CesT family type III secretion system chaperone [Noviherbaspirillum pedocola]
MTQSYHWRRKFIEVVEEVFRDLGFEPPPMTHDPDTPLVMDLELEGITFEVLHHPKQHADHCLVEVNYGELTEDIAPDVLMRLLSENLGMARSFGDRYAANVKSNSILYCYAVPLEGAHGSELLASMRTAAARSKEWQSELASIVPRMSTSAASGLHSTLA